MIFLMMILIGFTTDTSVSALFLGGIVPGLLIGVGLMVVAYLHAVRGGEAYVPIRGHVSLKRVLTTGVAAGRSRTTSTKAGWQTCTTSKSRGATPSSAR